MKNSNYDHVFTGSGIQVNYLKGILDEEGISSVIRDDYESQVRAGFNGGYTDQVLLFAEKGDVMRAKRITERALNEDAVPPEVLEKQATESRLDDEKTIHKNAKRPLIKKGSKNNRSLLNIVLNVALIIYSIWRLYPLLVGEELSAWRILLSGFILVFCSIAVVNYFRK